jgi:hypothetical protein
MRIPHTPKTAIAVTERVATAHSGNGGWLRHTVAMVGGYDTKW